ncbi:PepSY domain-containing protein [Staphylococcus aureus]|uniref:PepSY domain-containing protein n=1 Tax=Sphingomonas sp. S-NIH.Pt1_0416 TaxID=1920123 RepID=UPI000F7DDC89|nr:PepSY domain-containing protein [Sphingomonas sp. S-NIH.Pt1_0416]MDG6745766.1 PepSY domain-containing protein [Staphylococcus aureus]RSU65275.1 peptidase M4 [Sphingomonas sp. S-NIH.Pt1_0416]
MKSLHITLATVALVAMGGTAVAAPKMKGSAYAAQAKVSLATARVTALKARPGKITDQELEKEKGGSGLRYSFDITSNGKPFEVGVDAKTGAVLENIPEGKNPD